MTEYHWALFEAATRRRTDRGDAETLIEAVRQAGEYCEAGTYWIVYTDDLAIVAQGRCQDCVALPGELSERDVQDDHDVCTCCWQGPPWPLAVAPQEATS